MQLTGTTHVAGADQLYDDLALSMAACATEAVEERGVFHLALSGGSTPQPFYTRLVIDPRFRNFPWSETHVWIVDERRVPEDDQRSNIAMIRRELLSHVPLRNRQIHPMPVLLDDPAGAYEAELRQVFSSDCQMPTKTPRLDFVLLGMGSDCHTASLFPQSEAININDRLVAVNQGAHVTPPDRVTMTNPLLNGARNVAVLVVGAGKREALLRVAAQVKVGPDATMLPITAIAPTDGKLTWFLDSAAAMCGS